MKTLDNRKAELEARRSHLMRRIAGIETELASHQDPDWEEMAIQRESDEVLEGMAIEAQGELRAIAAALERVHAGEYGACLRCGTVISAARLDLLPYTPFCKECAA